MSVYKEGGTSCIRPIPQGERTALCEGKYLAQGPRSHGQGACKAVTYTKPPDSGLQPPAAVSIKMQKSEAGRVELAELSSLAAYLRIRSTVYSSALRQIQGSFSTGSGVPQLWSSVPCDLPCLWIPLKALRHPQMVHRLHVGAAIWGREGNC